VKLEPKASFDFEHKITIPLDFKDNFLHLNFNLVDPIKKEKFGDPMIAFIGIEKNK
jgi:hypothetical protein